MKPKLAIVKAYIKYRKLIKEKKMAQVYVWDEFALDRLKDKVGMAETVEELKEAILSILEELPTEYVR